MSEKNPVVVIVGGGLVGSLAAIYLANRKGYTVKVYERRPDPRTIQGSVEGNRSINLALSVRGISALERVGAEGDIMDSAIPMKGRMIHLGDGKTVPQAYGDFGEVLWTF